MIFLPKEGVNGTLYLHRQSDDKWRIMTWKDTYFLYQGDECDTLEELRAQADTFLWASGWPRLECYSPTLKMKPCVRVEFEYEDGRIQRLSGDAAQTWFKNVNDVIVLSEVRGGLIPMNEHPWTWFRKEEPDV